MPAPDSRAEIALTLPDGSVRRFPAGTTGTTVAESIGKRLARDAVAVRVDGELRDLYLPIERDAGIAVVTRESEDGLGRSEEHTSELQSLMRISYAVFCLKKKIIGNNVH